jgi:transcriptional regulator with XRE-family HTH domain
VPRKPKQPTFGANLREARQAAGLSQSQLGERIGGVTRNVIWRLEADDREPRLTTILRLAEALDLDPAELLRGLKA